jgi:hypothetical protein
MDNEAKDFFFGGPVLLVKCLTSDNIERAIQAIVPEDDGRWLKV